ncbi:MAG: hypothetical protein ABI855_08640 [Bacteroidota bacterium]
MRNNIEKGKTFEDFLKKTNTESKKVDWEDQKAQWLKSLESFYNNIKGWLEPFRKKGLIEFKEKTEQLSEDNIGIYDANALDIFIGNKRIRLVPKGTMIVGSYGRIDMEGPKGRLMIIQPEWNKWVFLLVTRQLLPGIPISPDQRWEVTEESFQEVIEHLV